MTEHDIQVCLETLGCRRIKRRGREVFATCPNEGDHIDGTDDNPSFSVRVVEGGPSPCSCFGCDLKDVFEHLVTVRGIQGFSKGDQPIRIHRRDDWLAMPRNNRAVFGEKEEDFYPPESALKPFTGQVHRSILNRGFTLETAKAWELGYDARKYRAIFVVRDVKGRLRGISGRRTRDFQKAKYLHYTWDTKCHCFHHGINYDREKDFIRFKKNRVLYGEHMINWDAVKSRFLVICEGPTDVLWLWQNGYMAVAVQGKSISEVQAQTVLSLLPSGHAIMSGADQDAPGQRLAKALRETFVGKVPFFEPSFPEGSDPAGTPADMLPEIFSEATPIAS